MLEALFPSQASPVLFGVLCVLYALLMFGLFHEIKTFVSYKRKESFAALLSPRLSKFYFYGYSLEEIYRQQFFTRYRKFVDHGFCYAVAAMNMIALHDIPSCRLVYGTEQENSEIYEHAWIEFYHRRTWWVMDPLWLSPGLVMSRRTYYRGHEHKNLHVYTHDDFWSYAVTHQLKEKLQHPETSFLLFEIWELFGLYAGESKPFHPQLTKETIINGEDIGKYTNPYAFIRFPKHVLFTKPIVHDFMTKPKRERAKAKHIRYARKLQRHYNRQWQKIKAEKSAAKASDSSVAATPQEKASDVA